MRRIVVLAVLLSLCAGPVWAFHPRRKRTVLVPTTYYEVGPIITTTYLYPPVITRTYSYESSYSYGSGGVIIYQPLPRR